MDNLKNLKAGGWDEAEARKYIQLVQWAAQRLRSVAAESVGAVYTRSEERFGDSYIFTRYPDGRSGSLLLEATLNVMAKPVLEPVNLVNIIRMVWRHPSMRTAMAISAQVSSAEQLDLEPQLSWLN